MARNLPFDSDVRQWNHPLMIPLHWWWAESNNRARSHFECDVTWFCFCFDFVRSHARCRCCFIVCFQVGQIKQPDCKMSTKNVNNYKWKTFPDIFRQLHKATKKQIVKLQLNEKKSKEKLDKIIELILKTKADLKEGPDKKIIVILGLWFLLNDWLSFREGFCLKLNLQGQGGGKIFEEDGQGWASYLYHPWKGEKVWKGCKSKVKILAK